jgi:hypothetical protein
MSLLNSDERRAAPRRRLGRLATISGIGISQRYCIVSNISAEGVRIHANGYAVPDDFTLLFPGDGLAQSGNYKVVWRQEQDIGAKFISAATPNV